jgi:transcriptional regulator with XRE-family HTH domain
MRVEFRQARPEAGATQESVAKAMDWSPSRTIRIETDSVGISTNDFFALLQFYGINDSWSAGNLVVLARAARRQSSYSKYREQVPSACFQYIDYEAAVSVITRESQVMPGLLQRKEYATKLMRLHGARRSPKW